MPAANIKDYYGSSTVYILEVMVYDRFLNEQEDQQVRSYLGTKGNVPFNPIPLQPPQGWWQADKDWITDSNGTLMQWKDQSGNNRHLVSEPSVVPPTLETWVNGKPAARFNGSSRLSVLNLQLLHAPKVYTLILTLQKQPGVDSKMPAAFGADLEHANNLYFKENLGGLTKIFLA